MPSDLKPAGNRETFTATLTYDTLELYGEVKASYEIVVAAGE